MEITVAIVNWNTRDLLLSCVRHLKGLGVNETIQIIVVDNGSRDGSARALRATFGDVELIENDVNVGFAKANNQALQKSKGRFILLLNPDCFPQPGAVESLKEALEGDIKAAVAGGALLDPDGSPQNSFHNAPTLATELLNKSLLQWLFPRRYPSKRHPPQNIIQVEAVLGAFMMVKRDAWFEVGGMDERYFLFLEETDLCTRLRKRGWRVIHVPHAKAVHLQGQSASLDIQRSRVEFYRSRYRYFEQHRGRPSNMILRVGILARLLLEWMASGASRWFHSGSRVRHGVHSYILKWHLKGCPPGWGLEQSDCPQ
jgi:hypothetical protein